MAIRGTNNNSNNGGYDAGPNYGDGVSPDNLSVPEEGHPTPTVANPVWDRAPWDAMCEHELEGHQADSEESYVDLRHDPETGNLVLTVHNLGPYSPIAIQEVVGWEDPDACGLSGAYSAKRKAEKEYESSYQGNVGAKQKATVIVPDDGEEEEPTDYASIILGWIALIVLFLGIASLVAGWVLNRKEQRAQKRSK